MIQWIDSWITAYNWIPSILEIIVAAFSTLLALIALWQASKSVKISNKQQILEKRINAYLVVTELFRTYQDRSDQLDPSNQNVKNEDRFIYLQMAARFGDLWKKSGKEFDLDLIAHAGELKNIACSIDMLWKRRWHLFKLDEMKGRWVLCIDKTHMLPARAARHFVNRYADVLLELNIAIRNPKEDADNLDVLNKYMHELHQTHKALSGGILTKIGKPGGRLNEKLKKFNRLYKLKDDIRL